ncbi:MAG: lactate racemase domain-containing protein, partial [Candidatus Eisenbacteria bacterium]
ADVVLAVGATAFHYFAGFGGGPKLLFPGLGARDSIAANHRRALGPWPPGGLAPGVAPGRLAGNPVAEDLAAAAALLPAATHLTSIGPFASVVWRERAEFVALSELFADGRRLGAARTHAVVVASAGGHPRDIDVVQAHKALFHAALYAADGAHIVLAADCPEGSGSAAFERWLAVPDPARREEQARAAYDLNAQTAISLAAIAARCRVTWVGDGAPPVLETLGIARVSVRDGAAAVVRALEAAGPGARGAFLPVATDVVPAAA